MAINDALSAFAQKLGLQSTRIEDLQKIKDRLNDELRKNQDQLEDLKTRVAEVDAQLKAKKAEYDTASMGVQRILKSEFALLFRQQNQVLEKLDSISARIMAKNDLLHKTDLLIESLKNPATPEDIDEIADDLTDVLDDIKDENKSLERLNKVTFSKTDEVSDELIASISTDATPVSFKRETTDELDRMISEIN